MPILTKQPTKIPAPCVGENAQKQQVNFFSPQFDEKIGENVARNDYKKASAYFASYRLSI